MPRRALAEANYCQVAPHNPNGAVSTAASFTLGACIPNLLVQEYTTLGEDFFRTSSLTEGSTQTNDIFDFLHGEAAFGAAIARDVPVVAHVKERLATFLADKGGHECVIGEPDELKQFAEFCTTPFSKKAAKNGWEELDQR